MHFQNKAVGFEGFAKLSADVGGGRGSGLLQSQLREIPEKDIRVLAYVVCKLADPHRDWSNELHKHAAGTQYEQVVRELIDAKADGRLAETLVAKGVSPSLSRKWLNNIEECVKWASGRVCKVINALETARVPQARSRAEMLEEFVKNIETEGAYKAFVNIGYKATNPYSPARMPEVRLYAVSMLFENPADIFEKLFDESLGAIGKRDRAQCFMGIAEEKFGRRKVLLSSREADLILKQVNDAPKESSEMARYRKDA
jgi:hypothetical protein